jgi:hypothetical protein
MSSDGTAPLELNRSYSLNFKNGLEKAGNSSIVISPEMVMFSGRSGSFSSQLRQELVLPVLAGVDPKDRR